MSNPNHEHFGEMFVKHAHTYLFVNYEQCWKLFQLKKNPFVLKIFSVYKSENRAQFIIVLKRFSNTYINFSFFSLQVGFPWYFYWGKLLQLQHQFKMIKWNGNYVKQEIFWHKSCNWGVHLYIHFILWLLSFNYAVVTCIKWRTAKINNLATCINNIQWYTIKKMSDGLNQLLVLL